MTKPTEFLAGVSLLFTDTIWVRGSTLILVKQSVESTPVFSFLFMRSALAGVALGTIGRALITLQDTFDGLEENL